MTTLNERKENTTKSKANGGDKASTEESMAQLKNDFDALRDDFKSLLDSFGQVARSKSNEGLERGSELADTATEKARDTQAYVEEQVRANPLAAIGIALGAGFLISSLRR